MAGSGTAHLRERDDVMLSVEHLVVEFPAGGGDVVHAVSDVSFDLVQGETLGLVGESGCGKSTTGRAIMQLPPPSSGTVRFDGRELTALDGKELRRTRTKLQMIFQDAISSLNPRRTIRGIVGEGITIWEGRRALAAPETEQRLADVVEAVGMNLEAVAERRPHQFSGGQCQRICIARSLVLEPDVLICDEPVSALDVSVQAQILNLLEDMKARYGLTMVFIAHDLAVVKNNSDRVAVMYLGKLCEIGGSEQLYRHPAHPYTNALMASIPDPDLVDVPAGDVADDEWAALSGELPSPIDPPTGCRFRTRCPRAEQICADTEPEIMPVEGETDHFVACHFPVTHASATAASAAAEG
ncbi:MAG: oligopeptide/dipeptide ABC transporter ATP-binding protein [Actinomycetota bacterium]|nr:oligopeptide/dipeptide ABC transporter ATP-binding protein [Actinomycetota bacterium]